MDNVEIICNNLSKSFPGNSIFKNLSFKTETKKSISIVGSNGSGKSTLVKILANLIQPSKGSVEIFRNKTLLPKEKLLYKISLISPYFNLYDELSGFENLDFVYELKVSNSDKNNNSDTSEKEEKIGALLKEVNLYEKRNEPVKNYSSGMKQRLKLAFSVINDPDILLMDEPRSNLDKAGIHIMYGIAERQKEKGILIIATNEDEDKLICEDSINIEDYK